jgi:hypothetical protein
LHIVTNIAYNTTTSYIRKSYRYLSNFNYCPVTWHFCSEKIQKKNEKNQERALRFIYEDYGNTYEKLLKKSKLTFLKELMQLKHSK